MENFLQLENQQEWIEILRMRRVRDSGGPNRFGARRLVTTATRTAHLFTYIFSNAKKGIVKAGHLGAQVSPGENHRASRGDQASPTRRGRS